MRKIPKGAYVIGGVLIVAWLLLRRRRAAADAAAAAAPVGGWPVGAIPASFSYLSSAAPSPTSTPIGGLSAVDAAALGMLQQLTDKLAGSSGGSQTTGGGTVSSAGGSHSTSSGLETPFLPTGFTADDVAAAAARYASSRSYNGVPYVPHMVVQEGHIEVRNGVPGTYIKYETPGFGSSTEWTPLK